MDLGPLQNSTLDESFREGVSLMDVKRFHSTTVEVENLVMYSRNRFKRDTVSGAWKRQWVDGKSTVCWNSC